MKLLAGQEAGALTEAGGIDGRGLLGQYDLGQPATSTSGRNVARRAEVEVGATSQVDRGRESDWTTTA